MKDRVSAMAAELQEAPAAVRRQAGSKQILHELVDRCRRRPPQLVVTCARGSSGHAATFGKHLIERYLGIAVAAAAPNIATVYRQHMRLKDQLVLTISQSGRSDDLVEFNVMAKSAGAVTVAIVNGVESPLAAICDLVLPMQAGPELSVAATKSFIAALAMLLRMVAEWSDENTLRGAVERLPGRLADASQLDWSSPLSRLSAAGSVITIGRGPTLAIAREAALKLKETCQLHAEGFSSAEFQHGPLSLVSPLYPILMFVPADAAAENMQTFAAELRAKGAALFCTDNTVTAANRLPILEPGEPDADAICMIQSFYSLVVRLAELRGTDVDRPRHLRKVTRTR